MPINIDTDLLISLVEARPVLWDKSLVAHKDQFQTARAWNEVFVELNSDFGSLNEDRKKIYGKEAMKKWVNIRDAYRKSRNKELQRLKNGHSREAKRYIYADQLKFLMDASQRFKEDNQSVSSANENSEHAESDDGEGWRTTQRTHKRVKREHSPSASSPLDPGASSAQPEDRHMSFFKGVVPSLNTFSDDESIQFQMGVLQLITDIKHSRLQTLMDP